MKYFSNINLNKNELQNAVIHVVSSDGAISAPATGQIIYDQSVNLIKYYNGSIWIAANDLEIQIVGDSGSTTLLRDESLTFVGGINLTSEVDSSDRVIFNLDPSIVLASDITVPSAFVNEITGTDAYFVNLEVENIDAEVINSTDINTVTLDADTVNANTGNISTINSTDVTTYSIYADNGSIGTAIFSGTDVTITSNLTISSDLIIGGSISGAITTSDITGVMFSVVASDAPFDIETFDTLTFEGTEDEIEVSSPVDGTVKIGIVTNPTLSGDVTITGDLTVQGSTTTIDSQTLTVKDPLIELNTGIGNTNPHDLGIIMMRGASDVGQNVGFIWDETVDRFKVIYTPSNASDSVIDTYGYAPMAIGDTLVASDITVIGGKIRQYQGTTPNTGEVLIGGSTGFTRGLITGASDTGVVVTSSTDSIVVSIDIDGATDGTAITVISTDLLLLSDGGTEKRIHVGQLGSVFVRHDTAQSLSSSDEQRARQNISSVEIITSTFTGTGSQITRYFPHNLGNKNVLVQIFDNNDIQVYADVNTSNANYCSVTGNFENVTYTVRIMGTRGTALTVTSSETAP